jgi:ABC-type transport system substrate-binding protein
MTVVRSLVPLVCLTLAAAGLSACARERSRCDAPPPPTVRIAMPNLMAPRVANRTLMGDAYTRAALLALDRQGETRPALAKAWSTDDRRTWTLTLRDGLRAHDGRPLAVAAIRDLLLAQLPALAGLRVHFYASARAAWAALLRNDADMVYQVPSDALPLLAENPDVQLIDSGPRYVAVLGFQQRHPVLRDVRVRQALNLAIDRDEIARRLLLANAGGDRGPFSPAYWATRDAGAPWSYDPAAARALLAPLTQDGRVPLECGAIRRPPFSAPSRRSAPCAAPGGSLKRRRT